MPKKIGRYTVEKALGSGAHGAVWQAKDSLLGRTVAIKLLKAESADTEGLNKSLHEAQTLAKLNHPNIVTLYEVSEHEGQPYLVMEYLDGAPLNEYLENQSPKPTIEVLVKFAEQLVDALKTAHAHGIVHADIKPANILVREDGCPVLVDFGLAKTTNTSTDLETVTNDHLLNTMVMGTFAYMSPEVMRGDAADEKADIFSLGAVFYEVFYGERAFKAPSDAETIHLILNIDPSGDPAQLPEWLATIITRMLAKKREERPENFIEIQETFANPTSKTTRIRKKRYLLTAAIAASLTIGIVSATQYNWQSPSVSGHINAGLEKLRNFEEKGAIAEAKAHFQAVLTEDPQNAAATAGYSIALLTQYSDQETDPETLKAASASANLAIQLDDQLSLAYTAVAWVTEYQGDMEQAESHYKTAILMDPNSFLNFEGYGRFLSIQGKFKSAIEIYKKAIQIYPAHGAFYTELGENYRQLGNYDEAEEALREAIKLSPDSLFPYLTLSVVLYSKDQTIQAIQVAQQGLQIRPHQRVYGNLGTFYFTLGQYPQAARAFEKAIDISGNSHNYIQWANLADAYRMLPDKAEQSTTAYKRALQLLSERMVPDDTRPAYVSRAALYHAKAGEITEAQLLSDRAIKLSPNDSSILFRAAIVADLNNNRNQALALISKAISLGYPVNAVKSEPDLKNLREDPLYHQLLAERDETK